MNSGEGSLDRVSKRLAKSARFSRKFARRDGRVVDGGGLERHVSVFRSRLLGFPPKSAKVQWLFCPLYFVRVYGLFWGASRRIPRNRTKTL